MWQLTITRHNGPSISWDCQEKPVVLVNQDRILTVSDEEHGAIHCNADEWKTVWVEPMAGFNA